MIVDLMRNDLSRVCRPGTVTVDELLDVQPHSGRLAPGLHGARRAGRRRRDRRPAGRDLPARARSPGRRSGPPTQAIAALEPEPRGAYTGALGLVVPGGRRRAERAHPHLRDRRRTRLQLGVGGGITADSVPIREWYECLHKAAPLVTAVGRPAGRRRWPRSPDPPAADLLAAGVFETRAGRATASRSGWPGTWPGWTAPSGSSTASACPTDLPARVAAALADADPRPAPGPAGRGPAAAGPA